MPNATTDPQADEPDVLPSYDFRGVANPCRSAVRAGRHRRRAAGSVGVLIAVIGAVAMTISAPGETLSAAPSSTSVPAVRRELPAECGLLSAGGWMGGLYGTVGVYTTGPWVPRAGIAWAPPPDWNVAPVFSPADCLPTGD
jgi:hypothetical protein